jgi:hypothetical protein
VPRVPTQELPTVQSRPVATPFRDLQAGGGLTAVSQGLGQVVHGAEAVNAVYQRAKARADQLKLTEQLTDYTHSINTTLYGDGGGGGDPSSSGTAAGPGSRAPLVAQSTSNTGFMQTRGKAAAKASVDALDALEKHRQDIAGGIEDEKLRGEFLAHSGQLYESARRQVEMHVGDQIQAAELAGKQALLAEGYTSIANSYADEATVATHMQTMEQALRRGALSKEDGDGQVAAMRQKVAEIRLNQYVASKDWKGAQALFAQAKNDLGEQSAQFEHVIATLREKQEGDALALETVNGARKPNGFVDEAKAIQAWQAVPKEQRTDEAQQAFDKWMSEERDKRKAAVGEVYNRALGAYLKRHSLHDITAADQSWLRQNDSEGWLQLERINQANAEHYRAMQNRVEHTTPEQAAQYGALLLAIADDPQKYGSMSAGEFARDWSGRLSLADLQKGFGELAQAHERASKPAEPILDAKSAVKEEFRSTFGLKADSSTWTDQQRRIYADVATHVAEREAQFRKNNGGKSPTADDYHAWTNERLVKGTVPGTGTFSDDSVTRAEFERNPEYTGKNFVEGAVPQPGDLPDAAITAISRIMKARGMAQTRQSQLDLIAQVARGIRASGGQADAESITQFLVGHAPSDVPPLLAR